MITLIHHYIDGRLVYVIDQIYCAYCNFAQPTRRVKGEFGYTAGLTVNKEDWQHGAECPQTSIIGKEENGRSTEKMV